LNSGLVSRNRIPVSDCAFLLCQTARNDVSKLVSKAGISRSAPGLNSGQQHLKFVAQVDGARDGIWQTRNHKTTISRESDTGIRLVIPAYQTTQTRCCDVARNWYPSVCWHSRFEPKLENLIRAAKSRSCSTNRAGKGFTLGPGQADEVKLNRYQSESDTGIRLIIPACQTEPKQHSQLTSRPLCSWCPQGQQARGDHTFLELLIEGQKRDVLAHRVKRDRRRHVHRVAASEQVLIRNRTGE
jgi:hypothetical protein